MPDDGKNNVTINITATDHSSNSDVNITVYGNHIQSPSIAPFQPPGLPNYFVDRPEYTEVIKGRLLNTQTSHVGLVVSAFHGQGGIGKTTLASFLAHNNEIRNHFSDGVLWVTLGQEPKILSLLHGWIRYLDILELLPNSEEDASLALRRLLQEKSMFIVIDDAWRAEDVRFFQVGGSKCQTLITTRDSLIATVTGATLYELDILDEEQSLKLLVNFLCREISEDEKEKAKILAKEVSYLPQALELVAVQLKDGLPWNELIRDLNREVGRLKALEMPGVDELDEASKRKLSLDASISLSLRSLPTEKIRFFVWLGILPEDVIINSDMAATLWGTSQRKAFDNLRYLKQKALLLSNQSKYNGFSTYRIHDLILDKARDLITNQAETETESFLPSLGLGLQEAHAAVLNSYRKKTQNYLWHTLKDDGYIHNHLTWHMEKAGWVKEIHTLLSEDNFKGKNGWYEVLECLGKSAIFIEDISRARKLVEKESESQIKVNEVAYSIGLEVRYGLLNTSINSLSANIPAILLNELLKSNIWTSAKVLMYAQREPDHLTKLKKLLSIILEVDCNLIKNKAIEKAIDSAYQIHDEEQRIEALALIVPCVDSTKEREIIKEIRSCISKILDKDISLFIFPLITPYIDRSNRDKLIKKALDSISTMEAYQQLHLLSYLIPCVDSNKKTELIKEALHPLSTAMDNDFKLNSLICVIPHLENDEKKIAINEAFDVALSVLTDFLLGDRSDSPYLLVPYLTGDKKKELISRIYDTVLTVAFDGFDRAVMISSILPLIDDASQKSEVLEKALYYTSMVEHESEKRIALSSIIPHVEEGTRKSQLIEQALICSLKIEDECQIVRVRSSIIPYITNNNEKENLVVKVLDNVSKIQDMSKGVNILSSIIPYVDGNIKDKVIENALDYTLMNQADFQKVQALSSIISHVKGNKKEEVMEKILYYASKNWPNSLHSLYELSSVFPYFEGTRKDKLEKELLDCASKIEVEQRIEIMSSILPYFEEKEETIRKVLDDISKIKSESQKVKVLSSMLPYLKEKEKILEYISEIEDDLYKAKLISCVIPHLEKKRDLIKDFLNKASNIEDEYQKLNILISVLPYIEDSAMKEKLIEETFSNALKIKDDYYQSTETVVSMLQYLEESKKEEVIEKVFSDIMEMQGEYENINVLNNILPFLEKDKKEKILKKIFKKALLNQNKRLMEKILGLMVSNLDKSIDLYSVWKELIDVASGYSREDFLEYVQFAVPLIHKLGGEKALIEISFAIDDSSRWWP